jgi:hypothetical protein
MVRMGSLIEVAVLGDGRRTWICVGFGVNSQTRSTNLEVGAAVRPRRPFCDGSLCLVSRSDGIHQDETALGFLRYTRRLIIVRPRAGLS